MKRKQIIALLMAIVMLLLTACGSTKNPRADKSDLVNRYEYGSEFGLASKEPIKVPKLLEMEYVHYDTTELIDNLEALIDKVPEYKDADTLFKDYFEVYKLYREFQTQRTIVYLRFAQDQYDEYYAEEYNYCEEQSDIIWENFSDLYAAFAKSPLREELEEKYFYKGYFDEYEGYESASDEYFKLKDQESALEMKYLSLTAGYDWNDKYSEVAEIYIELAKVRKKIALERGYDNYLEYAYKENFGRDYTPEDVDVFLESVKEYLVPLTKEIVESDAWDGIKVSEFPTMLSDAAKEMGGPIAQAAELLITYELYDMYYSDNRRSIGYEWYIPKYEVPYIFGNSDEYRTFCHEFGHFTEDVYSYDLDADTETGEIFSQAMEFLAISYTTEIADLTKKDMLKKRLARFLGTVKNTCIIGALEKSIYTMDPDELTVEKVEKIYREYQVEYNGFADKRDWVYTHHLFDFPVYYISYALSVIPSILISKEEYEATGAGVARYCKLLDRTPGKKFSAVLEEAGIGNPFKEETIKEVAEFYKEFFNLKK